MTDNQRKTEILYKIIRHPLKQYILHSSNEKLIEELIADDFIFEVSGSYRLTGKANKILTIYNTLDIYEKSLEEERTRLPAQIPTAIPIQPQTTKSHVGTGLKRKSFSAVINITKNDYFKFILIGLIVGLTVAYFVFIFKWNK